MDKSALPKRTGLPKLIKQTSINETERRNAMGPSELTLRAPLPGSTAFKLLNNPLRRRSKSVSDLSCVPSRQKIVPMETIPSAVKAPRAVRAPPVARVPLASRPPPATTKRHAPEPQNGTKAKMPKKQQVPSWDYKTRYAQLNEQYTKHQETCRQEEYKSKILEQEAEIRSLKEEIEGLSKNNTAYKNKLKAMEKVETELQRTLSEKKLMEQEFERKQVDMTELIKKLESELMDKDKIRLQLHNTVQELKGNIRVFCRVRPPISIQEEHKERSIFEFNEDSITIQGTTRNCSGQSFKFDKVFQPESTQAELFEELSQLVQSALDGYNVCIFAYGQTGSGKTYTMQGSLDNSDDSGMIPRTINLLFDSIETYKLMKWTYKVKASFLEIYNENVYDLTQTNNQNLGIRYNKGKGTTVDCLKEVEVDNVNQLQELIKITQSSRKVAATNYNARSSRSHAITKICLEGLNEKTKLQYNGSITLVDLAGSENAKATINEERLTETKNINTSLMTLGQVMAALYQKCKHVPYRNSKLTYLLQSSLGGNSKTLMIVNVTPFEQNYQENLNSLRFAATVKEVKNAIKKNKLYSA